MEEMGNGGNGESGKRLALIYAPVTREYFWKSDFIIAD